MSHGKPRFTLKNHNARLYKEIIIQMLQSSGHGNLRRFVP